MIVISISDYLQKNESEKIILIKSVIQGQAFFFDVVTAKQKGFTDYKALFVPNTCNTFNEYIKYS